MADVAASLKVVREVEQDSERLLLMKTATGRALLEDPHLEPFEKQLVAAVYVEMLKHHL